MLSKKFIRLFLALLFVSACQNERLPRHQKAIPEGLNSVSEEVFAQNKEKDLLRYDNKYLETTQLIEKNTEESLILALKNVEADLYSDINKNKEMYTDVSYVGKLHLFVRLFKSFEVKKMQGSLSQEFESALARFNNHFIKPCTINNQCELFKESLKQESSLVVVVVYLANKEIDLNSRLKLLGLAYDLSGRRSEEKLNGLYLSTLIDLFNQSLITKDSFEIENLNRHLNNVTALVQTINWTEDNLDRKKQYNLIKPWLFSRKAPTHLNEIRGLLLRYLPLYVLTDKKVEESVQNVVNNELATSLKTSVNLKNYPAFSNLNLESFKKENVLAAYVVRGLYFKKIDLEDANTLFSNVENKELFYSSFFKLTKTIIRWDIAQLSIETTKKLSVKFAEQDIKTKVFVQDSLDWSKKLTPLWTEFHSVRLWSLKSFLEMNVSKNTGITHTKLQEFFSAINRNILKTTVYPNMLAFSYYMAKTEWSSILRILWFKFDLDTTVLLDYMFAGQYQSPWFNFVNMSEASGTGVDDKTALYRSEMLDSLHYFFSTKTFEVYGIEPNDFLKVTGDTILKKRKNIFEKTIETQKELYFSESGHSSNFLRWCEGIKNNEPIKETISFYHFGTYNTPVNINSDFQEKNSVQSFYYGDVYKKFDYKTQRLPDINDRFRMEYLPILSNLKQYYGIAKRISTQNPSLPMGGMKEFKKYVDEADLFASKYWGTQQSIDKMMQDCLFVGYKESKRRTIDLTFAQVKYFKQIVHPLLKKVTNKQMSLEHANKIIQDFHNNQKGVFDEIVVMNSGRAKYISSQNGYILRSRMLFLTGIDFIDEEVGSYKSTPIVGAQLTIPLPLNQDSDVENNPYTSKANAAGNIREIYFEEDVNVFSSNLMSSVGDEMRSNVYSIGFTQWDQHDTAKFAYFSQYQIEFYLQKLLMKDVEYINFLDSDCMIDSEAPAKKCFKKDTSTYAGLTKLIADVYGFYKLDERDREYLDLIKEFSYVDSKAMQVMLKLDITSPANQMQAQQPFQEIAGVYDLVYQMLRSDYLGLSFQSEWDVYSATAGGMADKTNLTCEGLRDGCVWKNEKIVAKDFFISREKRPGFIFKFDDQILVEDFNSVKTKVLKKFQTVLDLEKNGEELLKNNVKNYSEPIYFHMDKEPMGLYPLSRNFQNFESLYKDFFVEETEEYFLKDQSWDKLLIE